METSLHHQLKLHYAACLESTEVVVDGFRIDAITADGELIEIQHASLAALRKKAQELLPVRGKHRLRIVKPIVLRKRVTTLNRRGGATIRSRMSPKTGDWIEIFMELVHFCSVFPRKRLTLEVLMIEAEETRVDRQPKRRRGKAYKTLDLRLIRICHSIPLKTTADLIEKLPLRDLPDPFTTAQLAKSLDRPRWFAQKVAYCLRKMGAIASTTRKRHGHEYAFVTSIKDRRDCKYKPAKATESFIGTGPQDFRAEAG